MKKHFVDAQIYDDLLAQKNKLQSSLNNLVKSEELKVQEHDESAKLASSKTTDTVPLNEKCPVSQKDLDDSKFSIFDIQLYYKYKHVNYVKFYRF